MNYKRIRECPNQDVKEDCQPSTKKSRSENEQILNFNDPPLSVFNSLKIPRKKIEQKVPSNDLLMNTVSPILPPLTEFESSSRNIEQLVKKAVDDDLTIKLDNKTAKLKYYRCKECHLNLSSQVTLDAHYAGSRHAKKLKELELSNTGTCNFKKDKISKLAENDFKCKLCDVKMRSLIEIKSHIDGSKHKKNIDAYYEKKNNKRKNEESFSDIKPLEPVTQHFNDDKSIIVKTTPNSSFYCEICGLCMNSQKQYDQHINSKKHSVKVTKLSYTFIGKNEGEPKTVEFVPDRNS